MENTDMENTEERILSGLTIRIARDRCIASKNCIEVAPEVFALGDDQIVTFVRNPRDIERERLIEACAVCPTDTLLAFDESGKQLVP